MPKFAAFVVVAAAFLGSVAIAEQRPPANAAAPQPSAKRRAPAGASAYQAVATVQDLMAGLIDPASKVVFKAVSSEDTPNGSVEKAPKDDAEWAFVRRNALFMVEGANLLLMPGRHIAPAQLANEHAEGELPPAEIEVRVAKDRAAWNNLATKFRQAAQGAVKAAEGKKKEDFGSANEAIDNACESCHLRFWYPDQEKLLEKAARPK